MPKLHILPIIIPKGTVLVAFFVWKCPLPSHDAAAMENIDFVVGDDAYIVPIAGDQWSPLHIW